MSHEVPSTAPTHSILILFLTESHSEKRNQTVPRRAEFNCAVAPRVVRLERKLTERDHQPVEVGGDNQSGLPA